MNPREVWRMIKVWLILNKITKAKEAAMREFLGLPPKLSWTGECVTTSMTCVKDYILHIFCPCCIYDIDRRRKRLACLSSPIFKEFVGFVSGLVVILFIFFLLVYQMDVHPRSAFIGCSVGSVIVSLLLAFSLNARCIVIMTIPQFFSGKGRMFLLMYALFLVMNHPVKNAFVNITVMSQSATCGQEMALNETKSLIKAATAPLEGLMANIKLVVSKLVDFSNSLRDTYLALSRTVKAIGSVIASAAGWLVNITDRCKNTLGSPYKQCLDAFRDGERKCRDHLGFFKGICSVIRKLNGVCHIAKVGQVFCFVVEIFKKFIVQPIDSGTRNALKSARDMFYFNVTIDYKFNYTFTQSKSYSQVRKDIANEISSYMNSYMTVIDYLKNFLLLTIIFIFVKAMLYRYRWLSNDRYDNTYITFTILDLDNRRKEKGKPGIMPLEYEEEMKYISDASSDMTRRELINLAAGLVLFIFSAFNAGFYLFCDYGLYSVLNIIKKNFGKAAKAPVPPHTKLQVVGRGPMADMYKSIVSMFEPVATSNVDIDVTPCVPNPSEPDWNIYRTIGYIYLACLIMTIGEAYALRLRHMIMGCYFPRRERKRAIWLYNHIMKTRGGLKESARKLIRAKHEGSAATEHISLKGRLAAMFPICEKIFKFFGWEVKSCLYCGREGKPDDYVLFIHCSYFDCDAIYCVDCYSDLDNICPVCNNAVDIGGSVGSDEMDSSINELEKLKAAVQRKQRNEKIKALQAERTTSRVMARFNKVIGPRPSSSAVDSTQNACQISDSSCDSSGADGEGDVESDDSVTEQRILLKRPKNLNQNSINLKKPSTRERVPGRSFNQVSRDSRNKRHSRVKRYPREKRYSDDKETSTSVNTDDSDYENTSSSSCDTDDLDFSYQYEPHQPDIVNNTLNDEYNALRHRRRLDLVSYDFYSNSDSDTGNESESHDVSWNVTEPVLSEIRRT